MFPLAYLEPATNGVGLLPGGLNSTCGFLYKMKPEVANWPPHDPGYIKHLALPFAVLAIPLIDLFSAIIRRLRAGQSPFSSDKEHLHHRILRAGNTHLRTAVILYLWTATIAFPAEFDIDVTVVVVVISRTSIKSPGSGGSVNVSTQVGSVPATEYASTGVCTISTNTVHIVAVGTCILNANQAGDGNYLVATQVQRSFEIASGSEIN